MLSISELSRRGRESLRGKWAETSVAILVVGIITSAPNLILNMFTSFMTALSGGSSAAIGAAIFIAMAVIGLSVLCLLWLVFVSEPIKYGLAASFLNMVRKGRFDFSDLLSAKKRYLHVVGTMLLPDICITACVLVALVVGLILSSPVSFLNDIDMTLSYVLIALGVCVYVAGFVYAIILSCAFAMIPFIAYDNPDKSATEVMHMSCRMMKGRKVHLFLFGLSFIGWYIVGILALFIGIYPVSAYVYSSLTHFYESIKDEGTVTESIMVA
mgnify:CR=1 FL=1